MEFRLDADQLALQQAVTRLCTDYFPLDTIGDRDGRVDPRAWRALADLGVFSLMLPEVSGGSGLGAVDAAIVFEQLGSHLVVGPVVWTLLAASLVDGASSGEARVGGVDASAVANGSVVVEHAGDLDVLLVLHADCVVAHRATGLGEPEPMEPLDPLTPVGRFVDLRDANPVGDAAAAATLRVLGTVLGASMLTGIADRALETARAHALDREQFGVPIGSFQAVKHLLADMYVRTNLARSATHAAAAVCDDPDDDPGTAVAAAKLLAADAAIENASAAVQVLGGMGFTWDMPPHYLLKRAWVLEQSFGSADDHATRLGETLAGTVS